MSGFPVCGASGRGPAPDQPDPALVKAGVMEDGAVHPSEEGTPQGGSISALLSNVYLHYVLDLWFERVVKVRLRGEARLVRYIDDFVICFQYREDALRVEDALRHRLGKFGLTLNRPRRNWSNSDGLHSDMRVSAAETARKRSIFWGPRYIARATGRVTSRLGCAPRNLGYGAALSRLRELMRRIRHHTISDQANEINAVLRGHMPITASRKSPVAAEGVSGRASATGVGCCAAAAGPARLSWDASTRSKNGT